jgi:hypothetical protein
VSKNKAVLLFVACLTALVVARCLVAESARGPNGEYAPPVRGFL